MAFSYSELGGSTKERIARLISHEDCERLGLPEANTEQIKKIVDSAKELGLGIYLARINESGAPVLFFKRGEKVVSHSVWAHEICALINVGTMLEMMIELSRISMKASGSSNTTTRHDTSQSNPALKQASGNDGFGPGVGQRSITAQLNRIKLMDARVFFLQKPRYSLKNDLLQEPVTLEYLPSTLLQHERPELQSQFFELPREYEALCKTVAEHQKEFNALIQQYCADDSATPILQRMQQENLLEELEDLARQAGGRLRPTAAETNGVFGITYHRQIRLKTGSLPPDCFGLPRASQSSLQATRHMHTLTFVMPIHFEQLRDLLRHDIEIFATLPEETKELIRQRGY